MTIELCWLHRSSCEWNTKRIIDENMMYQVPVLSGKGKGPFPLNWSIPTPSPSPNVIFKTWLRQDNHCWPLVKYPTKTRSCSLQSWRSVLSASSAGELLQAWEVLNKGFGVEWENQVFVEGKTPSLHKAKGAHQAQTSWGRLSFKKVRIPALIKADRCTNATLKAAA